MARARQTNTDKVRAMLARPRGASLDAICKATGWQAHSARAALSGMRKSGLSITREALTSSKGSGSIYRIAPKPELAE